MITLERKKLVVPDTPAELLGEGNVYEEASAKLRYTQGMAVAQQLKIRQRFSDFFEQLGIQPFKPEQVVQYKRAKLRRVWWKANAWRIGVGLLPAVVGVILTTVFWNAWPPWLIAGVTISGLVVSGILTVIITEHATRFEWQTRPLAGYAQPIPPSVLRMAMRIQDGIAAERHSFALLIESLDAKERVVEPRISRRPDPFLVIRDNHNNLTAHVAVWDEPSFEG